MFDVRCFLLCLTFSLLQFASAQTNPPIILTVEGTNVWVRPFPANLWESAYVNQVLRVKDRGRTGADSRTSVRLSDLTVLRIGWHSEFEIQPPAEPGVEAEFSLWHGLVRLLNRDRPGKHRFVTPTATAATRGTEFVLEVEETTGRTRLTVFEGEADLFNALGSVRLASGEQGIAEAGQAPVKTAVIEATNVVQWCLYYPGVLDPDDLTLTAGEQSALGASLAGYRAGDLLGALSGYPAGRAPASDAEKIYLAALLLSVGQVARSEALLDTLTEAEQSSSSRRLAEALRVVVDAVNLRPSTNNYQPSTLLATELLAESYYRQAQAQLDESLTLARRSVQQSPDFAFGWTRVAELEFSQGNLQPALAALDKSLALAPRNAQTLALKGFLFSAQNRIADALWCFEDALALDGGLGNAWLGRGLCRIRQGHGDAGRFDLQVAAALEPQRSALRSYLGKAFSNAGDARRAEQELGIARELDEHDPTPLLYSALLLRDANRINEAVRDLELSQVLNDNRRVYRSRLLLDQDRAVRGANLAGVYGDAGFTDVSVREAARAVTADYANYSAHLFLANSYNQMRDLKQINLRYETAWFSEYLLANLLAPVGAGTLSPTVSQQEYSKLFERDRLGLSSRTEYLSHGEWIQSAAQYGTFGDSSVAADFFYHHDDGQRPNNDLEQLAGVLNLKQQLTPQDSVYLRLNAFNNEAGDVNLYYDQAAANLGLRTRERSELNLLAGYHHEWSPGHHTLLLAGWLRYESESSNPSQSTLFLNRGFSPTINSVTPLTYNQNYRSELSLLTAELQQIWRRGNHTLVAGGRYQAGDIDTRSEQFNGRISSVPVDIPLTNDVATPFNRASLYVYDHWQVCPALLLAAGLSFDWLEYPLNYRYAPITDAETRTDQLSPKAGCVWTPAQHTTVRAAWFRSLGGVTLDQSIRLEPSQVAGFNQAYRSLIPESVAGANAAPTFESWAVSIEQKLGRGTFVGLAGELASSKVDRAVGVVDMSVPAGPVPATTPEELDFHEQTLSFGVNQLLGKAWSVSASYRVSRAELDDQFTAVPATATLLDGFQAERNLEAILHQLHLSALYHHRCGFFARAGAIWTSQSHDGYTPALPGDEFWQFNLEGGWRFARRRAEVRVALLNLTDQDYRLNPLNLTAELPRERTLAVSVKLNF